MLADLHTHTWHSDGDLAPAALVDLACRRGVDLLAITDHDGTGALADPAVRDCRALRIVPGVEISTQWRGAGIHVVGLGIDPGQRTLADGLAAQRRAREARARTIAARLERLGARDALASAAAHAPRGYLGRPHFASVLVEQGVAKDRAQAFRKYLGAGKPGDVKTDFAALDEAVGWLSAAGGIAVLAHPAKYRFTRTRLRALVTAFVEAGGEAIEVISGHQTPDVTQQLARLCREFGLLASCGSDFHSESRAWAALGRHAPLPSGLTPVWQRLAAAHG